MAPEDAVTIGTSCEDLLSSWFFNTACEQFKQQCFEHWMSTDPKHSREREAIYLKASALAEFLGHLNAYVQQKDELIKQQTDAISRERDAPYEVD